MDYKSAISVPPLTNINTNIVPVQTQFANPYASYSALPNLLASRGLTIDPKTGKISNSGSANSGSLSPAVALKAINQLNTMTGNKLGLPTLNNVYKWLTGSNSSAGQLVPGGASGLTDSNLVAGGYLDTGGSGLTPGGYLDAGGITDSGLTPGGVLDTGGYLDTSYAASGADLGASGLDISGGLDVPAADVGNFSAPATDSGSFIDGIGAALAADGLFVAMPFLGMMASQIVKSIINADHNNPYSQAVVRYQDGKAIVPEGEISSLDGSKTDGAKFMSASTAALLNDAFEKLGITPADIPMVSIGFNDPHDREGSLAGGYYNTIGDGGFKSTSSIGFESPEDAIKSAIYRAIKNADWSNITDPEQRAKIDALLETNSFSDLMKVVYPDKNWNNPLVPNLTGDPNSADYKEFLNRAQPTWIKDDQFIEYGGDRNLAYTEKPYWVQESNTEAAGNGWVIPESVNVTYNEAGLPGGTSDLMLNGERYERPETTQDDFLQYVTGLIQPPSADTVVGGNGGTDVVDASGGTNTNTNTNDSNKPAWMTKIQSYTPENRGTPIQIGKNPLFPVTYDFMSEADRAKVPQAPSSTSPFGSIFDPSFAGVAPQPYPMPANATVPTPEPLPWINRPDPNMLSAEVPGLDLNSVLKLNDQTYWDAIFNNK